MIRPFNYVHACICAHVSTLFTSASCALSATHFLCLSLNPLCSLSMGRFPFSLHPFSSSCHFSSSSHAIMPLLKSHWHQITCRNNMCPTHLDPNWIRVFTPFLQTECQLKLAAMVAALKGCAQYKQILRLALLPHFLAGQVRVSGTKRPKNRFL